MNVDPPRAALFALVAAVVVAILIAAATSGAAFGLFNPQWEGTSDLRTAAEETGSEPVVVRNTTQYQEYGDGDIAFVLAPTDDYGSEEATNVRGFLDRGGTLVIADRDGPHTPDLLESIGADARPDGAVLRDDRNHHRSPALPIAEPVSNHSYVAGVGSVTLNYGTSVEPNGATPLVATSEFAYHDRDGSGSVSDNETMASFPVVTVESVGDGDVVVVGDPSVFINVMQDDLGNRAFVEALVSETNHTVVDVSHGAAPPPLMAALLTVRDSPAIQVGLGLGALAAVGIGSRLMGRRQEATVPVANEETLAAGLRRIHTDLDRERFDRVTKGVISNRTQGDDDE